MGCLLRSGLALAPMLLVFGCPRELPRVLVDAGGEGGGTGPLSAVIRGPNPAYVGEDACFEAEHTGGSTALIHFVWGDGMRSSVSSEARVCHRYGFGGERLVAAIVEDGTMRAEASMLVRVVPRPSALPPTYASPIVYDAARGRVWTTNPDARTIAEIRVEPLELVREIEVCDGPRTIAIVGDRLVVPCARDGSVALVDAVTGEVGARLELGAGTRPYGATADPRGRFAFITLQDAGAVAVVDVDGGEVLSRLVLEPDLRGIAANADGLLLVTRWRSGGEGGLVFVVDATDPRAPALRERVTLPIDRGLDSDTDNSGVPSFLTQIAFAPDGAAALVPSLKANVDSGTFRGATPLTSQTTARAILSEITLASGALASAQSYRFSFDDLDYASALVFTRDGARVYVALQGSEAVVALDPFAFNVTTSIQGVGSAPQGLALSPDGTRLYVQAMLSRTVRVYDVAPSRAEPALLAEIDTLAEEPLPSEVLLGKQLFFRSRDPRMSRTSYLSCASCHMDGEGDNLVWDFTQRGEGLRNTVSLAGHAGTLEGPLHWSANFDEVQDFENDIRAWQGGSGFMTEAAFGAGTRSQPLGDPKAGVSVELDALAAYLGSLAEVGVSPAREARDRIDRGAAIFRRGDVGCATCHSGPRYTDSAFVAGTTTPLLHDVGTIQPSSGQRAGAALTGIDTPSLRGLWRTAPYLHDGSADTLRDVLTVRNAEDRHGRTSGLSGEELADLEAFLLSIGD